MSACNMIFNNINKSSEILKMNVEKPIFLADMCRVCMVTSDFLKEAVSYELTPKIVDMLNTFADIDISIDECLPSLICNTCYNRLRDSLSFKNICIESNNTLNNLLLKVKTSPEKEAPSSSTATSSTVVEIIDNSILCDNVVKIEEDQTTNSSSIVQVEANNVSIPKKRKKPVEPRKSPIVRRKRIRKASNNLDVIVNGPVKRERKSIKDADGNSKPKKVCKTRKSPSTVNKTVSKKKTQKKVDPVPLAKPTSSEDIIEICEIINIETPTVINLDGQEDIKIDYVDIKEPAIMFEPCPDLLSALGLIKRKRSNSTEIGVEIFSSIEEYNKSIDSSLLSNDSGRSTGSSNNNKPNTPINNNDEVKVKKESKWKRDFICHICNKELYDYGTFRRHLVTHGELPFPCKICDKRFKGARKLRAHSIAEHSGGRPYGCVQCDSKFRSLDEYTAHLRRHSGCAEPHVCPNCPKTFSSLRKLKEHSVSHEHERKVEPKKVVEKIPDFECSFCERRFRKKCDVERHERVHSGEKPYECLICNGRFQQAHNLTKHMVTHTGMKSYTCDVCNKPFGRSDVLARHMHVHEVNKPFTCQGCGRTFARHSQLITHMEKRHGTVPQNDSFEDKISE